MAFPRTRRVRAGSIDTFVAEMGPEGGRPVLFLHGNPDTHSVWEPVCNRLALQLRCIAPDLPGFGKTDNDQGVSLVDQSKWVRELCDALGLEKLDLVVHDVGGPYGLAFAAEYPARIRTLTILNTIFSPTYRWHFWARVWRTKWLGEASLKIMNKPLFLRELKRGSPRIPKAYAEAAYDEITPRSKAAVLRWYRAMDPQVFGGWDVRLRAGVANIPTRVIWGDLDPFIGPQHADDYGADRTDIHHLVDTGHWVQQEEPEKVAQIIGDLCLHHGA